MAAVLLVAIETRQPGSEEERGGEAGCGGRRGAEPTDPRPGCDPGARAAVRVRPRGGLGVAGRFLEDAGPRRSHRTRGRQASSGERAAARGAARPGCRALGEAWPSSGAEGRGRDPTARLAGQRIPPPPAARDGSRCPAGHPPEPPLGVAEAPRGTRLPGYLRLRLRPGSSDVLRRRWAFGSRRCHSHAARCPRDRPPRGVRVRPPVQSLGRCQAPNPPLRFYVTGTD